MITKGEGYFEQEDIDCDGIFVIKYKYYHDTGSYSQPPEEDLDFIQVWYNDEDITKCWWDYFDEDNMYEDVVEYARDNC